MTATYCNTLSSAAFHVSASIRPPIARRWPGMNGASRPTVAFFGTATAKRLSAGGHQADLMIANNVLAHVPDINDFVAGFRVLLKPQGVVAFEFPHILELIRNTQFDTIYHEHYSYLSLLALEPLFARHGLKVIDAERLTTHGGSLRLYVQALGCRRTRERDGGADQGRRVG